MKNTLLLLLPLLVLFACHSRKPKKDTLFLSDDPEYHNAINDQPAKTFVDFLRWYDANRDTLNADQLVGLSNDPTPHYILKINRMETFLQELKESKLVSARYICSLRDQLRQQGKVLDELKQNDGVPYGFETDIIMHSQDHREELAQIDDATVDSLWTNGNEGFVTLGLLNGTKISAYLSSFKSKWAIDSLAYGTKNYK